MESGCRCKFLLLDFGHPMNRNSMNNIVNSVEKILALALAFSNNTREMTFGVSILNSDFIIFESESHLRRNYNSIVKNLKASLKTSKPNSRVTVQEYKYLLSGMIETVLHEFQKFMKANNLTSESSNSPIQIAVVSKKTVSVLAEILINVTSKLQINYPNMLSIKSYKIVHILSQQDNTIFPSDKNMSIDWIPCFDNIYNFNCFFKEWLINHQQQLQILLSKELNIEVHCDVDDCIVGLVSIVLDGKLGVLKPPRQMEIINRLPMRDFCPTFLFGIPRRISATRCRTMEWTESQINSKMFKQLCQQLHQTGQGLLGKSTLSTGEEEINTFHLLTSDGDTLLMNDVASEELYLPSRAVASSGDESAATLIGACLEEIKYLDEYNPKHYSSGIYECLKDYLAKAGQNKNFFGHIDPNVKPFGKKDNSISTWQTDDISAGSNASEPRKKRPRRGPEMEVESVHPALLSPNVVEKFRRVHPDAFNLPELSNTYNDNSAQSRQEDQIRTIRGVALDNYIRIKLFIHALDIKSTNGHLSKSVLDQYRFTLDTKLLVTQRPLAPGQ